jgi:lipopolysaccharide transport system permease protein
MNNRNARLYIYEKVKANLKSDVSVNYLGVVWWILEPAMLVVVFYVVFGLLFDRAGKDFLQILIVGIVSWLWIASIISKSATSIFGARVLIAQVYLPKYCMPAVIILESVAKQLAVFVVLLTFLALTSGVHMSWLWMPVLVLVQLLMISAVSFWVAALVPFIPDIRYFVTAGLQMLMFCSGVFFRTINVPEQYQSLMVYNPVANIISQYRHVLVAGAAPDIPALIIISLVSVLVLLASVLFLRKFDLEYPRLMN